MSFDFLKKHVRKIISSKWFKIGLPTFIWILATFNCATGGKYAELYWMIVSLYWVVNACRQI